MRENYTIDKKNKIVVAKVGNLTENQLKIVRNYIGLGYTLQEYVKPKTDKFKREVVEKYLKENGTQKQIETYNKIINEPCKNGGTKKDGTPKTKGYVAGLKYFKSEFPKY